MELGRVKLTLTDGQGFLQRVNAYHVVKSVQRTLSQFYVLLSSC